MSNFSRHPIKINGKKYKTTEHYFQSQKFAGTEYEGKVRRASSPMEAAKIGRDRSLPLRKDWESVKDSIMEKALLAKFEQHPDLKKQLLETGDAILIEDTTDDHYWGCGSSGKGKNMLGKLLMKIRKRLADWDSYREAFF